MIFVVSNSDTSFPLVSFNGLVSETLIPFVFSRLPVSDNYFQMVCSTVVCLNSLLVLCAATTLNVPRARYPRNGATEWSKIIVTRGEIVRTGCSQR